jgi:hypothetical protein
MAAHVLRVMREPWRRIVFNRAVAIPVAAITR